MTNRSRVKKSPASSHSAGATRPKPEPSSPLPDAPAVHSQDDTGNTDETDNNDSRDTSSASPPAAHHANTEDGSASLRQRRLQRDRQKEREALQSHRHPSPYDLQEPRVKNGRTTGGTGRLPRDAAFTPTYINACTANSLIALVSIAVTFAFFYFKIIAGLLESPQIGRSIGFGGRGGPNSQLLHPDDVLYFQQFEGEPRIEIEPICPTDAERRRIDSITDDGCPHFGRIVVLADSIARFATSHATHGWIGTLVDEWAGRADVVVRTFPGYNTRWVNALLPDLLKQDQIVSQQTAGTTTTTGTTAPPTTRSSSRPSLIIIALGTDDAALPFTRQHVSLEEFTAHLTSIVETLQYPDSPNFAPHHRIVLVTPGPVHDEIWAKSLSGIHQRLDHLNNVTQEYVEAVQQVGQKLRIPVVDLWHEIMCQISAGPVALEEKLVPIQGTAAAGGGLGRDPDLERQQAHARDVLGVAPCTVHESSQLDHYLMDGLHLRRMGNEVLSKSILNTVAKHFPEMHPRCWKTIHPGYETLDPSADQTALQWHC
ncbi:isoamyl acetate-hydrolyzing esterase [Actinomortierella ambigua]|nr:isoamyl acetate-hydrolyzing esterase [Actinomortierella ambigua]